MTGNFGDFLDSLDIDPARRGRQFEHFVRWFLTTDHEWSTQVDQIWLWDEWPERWGPDCGIDLVFRHRNGEHWAVQAKCYAPTYNITKHDVDKFLSESNRPQIHRRLLVATTDRIGANARQVCEAQEKPVVRFLRSDFEKAELDYPASLADLSTARRRPRPNPRDHQREAIDAVVAGFQAAQRGQLIMACGTGKTYVTLWVKERLQAQRTLVLVPSLGLLSQILREWTFAAADPFEVLCVCSDQSAGARGGDESIHSLADLAFPVTSDANEIRRFLSSSGPRVVISTYQSSMLVAEAQADPAAPAFDLAVADEAHRCAGKAGSDFTAILDPATIRCDKRLFATATPRTYSSTVHKHAEERGVEIVGMDNVEQFGAVLHALPFGKAIERKLLTDYRVVIIGVDDPMIAQWITRRELVSTGTGVETGSESLAAQIGLLKAIQDYDLKRIISFHSRVSRAKAFAAEVAEVMDWCGEEHRPAGSLHADFVSGDMPTGQRRVKLDRLRQLAEDERAVLSNARCLSEGVDVPALDGVAFIDTRSSQVDIIQAVGRAIRLSADKKAGTIILPVFIQDGEDAVGTIEASNFKPVWEVLNALKSHDDVLALELDQIRTQMGQKQARLSTAFSKIEIDLPRTIDKSFGENLRTHLVEQVTESWDYWYGLLLAYVDEHGDSRVPDSYRSSSGARLGKWLGKQRGKKCVLPHRRIAQLESLPSWTWDAVEAQWEKGYGLLKKYQQENGNCSPPTGYEDPTGFPLRNWVATQRAFRRKGKLSDGRKTRLEMLNGWNWNPHGSLWDEGYQYLKQYTTSNGDCLVPITFRLDNGFRLGQWVSVQRLGLAKGKLSEDRKRLLESLPGWSWNPHLGAWEEGYMLLLRYVAEHGHAHVPRTYKNPESTKLKLDTWVQTQRTNKEKLTEEQRTRLDVLPGWGWKPHEEKWMLGYERLKQYQEVNGHVLVPASYKDQDGFFLGNWVSLQRGARNKMPESRKKLLEDLVGWVWQIRKPKSGRAA